MDYYLKFSPDFNVCEEFFSLLKWKLKEPYFQTLLEFHVPTAVLIAMDTIPPEVVYNLFKNMSGNCVNL